MKIHQIYAARVVWRVFGTINVSNVWCWLNIALRLHIMRDKCMCLYIYTTFIYIYLNIYTLIQRSLQYNLTNVLDKLCKEKTRKMWNENFINIKYCKKRMYILCIYTYIFIYKLNAGEEIKKNFWNFSVEAKNLARNFALKIALRKSFHFCCIFNLRTR